MAEESIAPRPNTSRMNKPIVRRRRDPPSLWHKAKELQSLMAQQASQETHLEQRFSARLHDGKSWVGSAKRLLEGRRTQQALDCLDALAVWMDTGRPGQNRGLRQRLSAMVSTWQAERARGVALIIRVSPAVPEQSQHQDLLVSAADNLLRNALKFTERGAVRVQIWHNRQAICLRVSDSGPGLGSNRVSDGWGLGLSFLRQEVLKLDGVLVIDTKAGVGTAVQIKLPRLDNP